MMKIKNSILTLTFISVNRSICESGASIEIIRLNPQWLDHNISNFDYIIRQQFFSNLLQKLHLSLFNTCTFQLLNQIVLYSYSL